jgi:hypothetical protein
MAKAKLLKETTSAFSVRLTDKIIGKVRSLANQRGQTINGVIAIALTGYIDDVEKELGKKLRVKSASPEVARRNASIRAALIAKREKANGVVAEPVKKRGRPKKQPVEAGFPL